MTADELLEAVSNGTAVLYSDAMDAVYRMERDAVMQSCFDDGCRELRMFKLNFTAMSTNGDTFGARLRFAVDSSLAEAVAEKFGESINEVSFCIGCILEEALLTKNIAFIQLSI